MSLTVVMTSSAVRIPDYVPDNLADFREWAGDNDLPEKTRVDYYKGEVWIDMGREQIFTHGLLKTEIAAVLRNVTKPHDLGTYWCNGILVTNEEADLSGNPGVAAAGHGRRRFNI